MSDKNFSQWLQAELNTRGWRPIDLSKRSKIDSGLLSRLLSDERKPGLDTCKAIAYAFGMRDAEVLRIAGLIDDVPNDDVVRLAEEDTTIAESYRIMKSMNRVERYQALQYLRFLREQSASYDADVSADRGAAPKSSGQTSTGKAKPATS